MVDQERCARCGFCLSVCPSYAATDLERHAPRGRLFLLREARAGRLASAQLAEPLDTCLRCGRCREVCPLDLAVDKAVLDRLERPADPLWRLLPGPGTRLPGGLVRGAARLTGAIPPGMPPGGARRLLEGVVRRPSGKARWRVGYFPGCVHEYLLPRAALATVRVLVAAGAAVEVLPWGCCGLPARSAGHREVARRLARANLASLPSGLDALITDCASCAAALLEYPELLPEERHSAGKMVALVRELSAFLTEAGALPPTRIGRKVTYHQPCHLEAAWRASPRQLLDAAALFREAPGAERCCGGAGTYFLRQPAISRRILEEKLGGLAAVGAEVVATNCPSCALQLARGVRRAGLPFAVTSVSEVLAEVYG
ncbi:MAG: (Fe-S)-binding protein [Thermaerobacter sp.]|nr:(Fe-S)-binding protein [Thermaerobacter sp.]